MKKVSYVLFFIVCMFFFVVSNVYADCSEKELNSLKELAKNMKIEYQENYNPTKEDFEPEKRLDDDGNVIGGEEEEPEYILPKATIDVIITGYSDKFYVYDEDIGYNFKNNIENNMLILKNQPGGKKRYQLRARSCGELIKTFTITLPKYNIYTDDPICEGISGDELSVCGIWYNYALDYETVKERVEQYKADLVTITEKNKKKEFQEKLEDIKDFFLDYYLYMIAGVLVIVGIVIYIVVKRKRSVLV